MQNMRSTGAKHTSLNQNMAEPSIPNVGVRFYEHPVETETINSDNSGITPHPTQPFPV